MDTYDIKNFFKEVGDELGRYNKNTINSSNPFVRYAHRNRIERAIKYVIPRLELGKVLDYGCGTGVFVDALNRIKSNSAFGYEPYMEEGLKSGYCVYPNYQDIVKFAPFKTITLFEVIEHLNENELEEFLSRCNEIIEEGGGIVISAPIEIGPIVIAKEMYRFLILKRKNRYKFVEFIKTALFGIPGEKMQGISIKGLAGHKGFDFRNVIKFIRYKGWKVAILGYGPFPLLGWYGNSQVFFLVEKSV
jgi:SAM-dependent methyltransferase